MKKYQVILMKEKDKRSKLVDELLNGIKIIKLYSWEESFKKKITGIRDEEVRCMNKGALYMVGIAFAFSCANFMVSLVLFITYLLIDKNNVLTANKVCFFSNLFKEQTEIYLFANHANHLLISTNFRPLSPCRSSTCSGCRLAYCPLLS